MEKFAVNLYVCLTPFYIYTVLKIGIKSLSFLFTTRLLIPNKKFSSYTKRYSMFFRILINSFFFNVFSF